MPQVEFDRSLEMVVLSAVRYSLPRKSYALEFVADFVEKHWELFTPQAKRMIQEDIEGFYGQSYADEEPWKRIIALNLHDKKKKRS